MKINELIWFKAIYPRGRDKVLDQVDNKGQLTKIGENEIKPIEENVKKIKEYIEINNYPPQPIKYNKNHLKNCLCGRQGYHIIDGTHTYTALTELGWKEIPSKFLEAIDIPVEEEMVYAIHYNISHGLPLSRLEVKACLANMMDDEGKLKYGTIKKLVKLWNIPEGTLKQWIGDIRVGPRTIGRTASDSSGNDGYQDDVVDLKLQLVKLEGERDKERIEKEELKAMKDDAMNDNMELKERIKKLEEQLDTIPKRCPKCNSKIY